MTRMAGTADRHLDMEAVDTVEVGAEADEEDMGAEDMEGVEGVVMAVDDEHLRLIVIACRIMYFRHGSSNGALRQAHPG